MSNKEVVLKRWVRDIKRGKELQCGKGSTIEGTEEIRKNLPRLIEEYNIKSINDAPCGSFVWMSMVDLSSVKYMGFDINYKLLDENRDAYPDIEFRSFDIINDILPPADLIMCRDCLIHFPDELVIKTLGNFRKSGAKYLLSTIYPDTEINENIHPYEGSDGVYGFRRLNLCIDPFNLGDRVDFIKETRWKRILGLWRL